MNAGQLISWLGGVDPSEGVGLFLSFPEMGGWEVSTWAYGFEIGPDGAGVAAEVYGFPPRWARPGAEARGPEGAE